MKVILKESGLYQETTELLDFNTSGSLKTHGALASSGSLTAGTITSTGSLNGVALNASGLASLDGGVDVNGSNFTVGTDGAVVAASLNNSSGGITNAGSIAGATTIDASGDLTVGTITMAEFTVDGSGNTDIDGTLNVEGVPTFQAQSVHSAGATFASAGLAACGAIAGATTIDASGDLTVGTITNAEFTVDADGNTDIDGTLNVEGVPTFQAQSVHSAGATFNNSGLAACGAIAGATTIDASGDLTVGTITMTEFTVDGSGNTDIDGTLNVEGAATLQSTLSAGATTVSSLTASGNVLVQGDLEVAGAINSVTKTTSILEVEDINIICASGSSASDADGGGLLIGGYNAGNAAAGVLWDNDHSNLQLVVGGSEVAQVSAAAFAVTGTLNSSGDAVIGGDLTISGNDVTFGNGATFANTAATFTLEEATVNIEAATALNLKSDAVTLGENAASDVALAFDATGGTGTITWSNTNARFEVDKSIVLESAEKVLFRDGNSYINSPTANDLEIVATDIVLDAATLIDLQSDAISLGEGGAADVALTFNTDGNNGVITWTDSGGEDYFSFSDDIYMSGTERVYFGATTRLLRADGTGLEVADLTRVALAAAEVKTMGAQFTVAAAGGGATAKVVINGAAATYGLNLPNTGTHGDAIANSWSTYSDATLKKDITPIENALEKVMSMKGVSYEYKSGGGRKVGFLAQDMKSVVPEVVKSMPQGDDKDLLCISYDQLTSVLVEAVKAQQAQIEDLKSEVVKLSDNS